MTNKKYIDWHWVSPYISAIAFAAVAWVFLYVKNSDYLYIIQGQSLFSNTNEFFVERMAVPSGFIQWAGCFFTQLFYYPALGSAALIAIWLLTYAIILRAFKIPNDWSSLGLIPMFALLCSIINMGYWMYYVKIEGLWFMVSLGFLCAIIGAFINNLIQSWLKVALIVVWTALLYPILGWYALLGTFIMAVQNILNKEESKAVKYTSLGTGIIAIVAVPLIYYNLYTQVRLEDAWTYGFPWLQSNFDKASALTMLPYYIMAISAVLFCFIRFLKKELKTKVSVITTIVVIGGGTYLTNAANFDDYNFQAEMRMYKYTDECEWYKVLEEAANIPGTPTRQMVVLKNIALMNTGQMGNMMYHYDNGGKLPVTRDSLKVRMVQTAGPLIYYNFGRINFAIRWAIENGVEYGYSVNDLKIMARSALINGEKDAVKKYTKILKTTTFYGDWAEEIDKLSKNKDLFLKDSRFSTIRELRDNFNDVLDGDDGLCEMYIIKYFGNMINKKSKLVQDLTLSYALINKSIPLFWPKFFIYAESHGNDPMPIHYQEAAFLYGNLEKNVDISHMPFDRDKIINRYTKFHQSSQALLRQGMSPEQAGEVLRPVYGDTFWWFYFFCRDVKSY